MLEKLELIITTRLLVGPNIDFMYKGKRIIGDYTIAKDIPITEIAYGDFMDIIHQYLGVQGDNKKLTMENIANGVNEGERHPKGIRMANHIVGTLKLDPEEAKEKMRNWNQKNKPPMKDKDIMRMLNQAYSYQSNPEVQKNYAEKKAKYKEAKETKATPKRVRDEEPIIALGNNYWLIKSKETTYLVNKNGDTKDCCNFESVSGPRFRKKILQRTKLPSETIDEITTTFKVLTQEEDIEFQKNIEEKENKKKQKNSIQQTPIT